MSKKSLIELQGNALMLGFAVFFLINWTLMPTPSRAAENWQTEWQEVLKAARQEGEVAVFGGSTVAGLKRSVNLFKKKFGINLHTVSGRSGPLAIRLMKERKAGLYTQDVHIAGQPPIISVFKPAGALDPLEPMLVLPEVVNMKLWHDERYDWVDTEGHYIFNFALYPYPMIAVNTDLVKPGEIKSYYDLLDPKWKGKIIISDPIIAGMSNSHFCTMLHHKLVDLDFFRQLAAQGHHMSRDQQLQLDWLSKGKYPIVLWPSLGRLVRFINAGAPVKPIEDIKEGTAAGSAGSALCLINKAPHPNAAKVFINWFLSKEGQTINQNAVAKQSRRVDVGTEGLSSFQMRRPGAKYFEAPSEHEEFILHEVDKYKALAKELFAPLLK
jgi:ABC-type Fe3+ transport system substrate-binding protein